MASTSFGGTVKLTGESEYQQALRSITDNLKVLNSELKVVTSQYDKNDTSTENLAQQNEVLNKKIAEQQEKVNILAKALSDAEEETGKNSSTSQKWRTELNNAQAELNKLVKNVDDNEKVMKDSAAATDKNTEAIDEFGKEADESGQSALKLGDIIKGNLISEGIIAGIKGLGNALQTVGSALIGVGKQAVQSYAEYEQLVGGVETLFQDAAVSVEAYADVAYKTAGLSANEYMETVTSFAASLVQSTSKVTDENAQAVVDALSAEIGTLEDVAKEKLKSLEEQQKEELKALKQSNSDKLAELKAAYQAQIDLAETAAEKTALRQERDAAIAEEKARQEELVNATKEANAKIYEDTKATLERENNVRKSELSERIAEVSEGIVTYEKTSDAYLEASRLANMAVIDMSDNANKMGTTMESIQNAYQGFAKQNYTMLDNLKLGYGGTQQEMYRLMMDAQKLGAVFKSEVSLDSKGHLVADYADIVVAIHTVQESMGITGTTAAEASQTISGSTGSMKAAWQNLITGIADDNADFERLVGNLVESIVGKDGQGGFINNMLPRIQQALDGIVQMVVSLTDTLLPQVTVIGMELITNLVSSLNENMPALLESASVILDTLINGIFALLPTLLPVAISLIETLVNSLLENLPLVLDAGILLLTTLAQGIASMLPDLIPLAINAVLNLVETLLDNIDLIVDAGISLLFGLADGLIAALPDLIEKAPVIIDKLMVAISNNLPKIVQAGVDLTVQLALGVVNAIPTLVAKIPQIITSMVSGFKNYYSNLGTVGKNMIEGLWNGINDKVTWLKNKISGFCDGVVDSIKSFFGIHSPSRLFKDEIGKNLALGVGEGFGDTMADVSADMQDAIPTEFDTSVNMTAASSSHGSNYDYLVTAFKAALKDVKVVMNNREMGAFIVSTVEREVYA